MNPSNINNVLSYIMVSSKNGLIYFEEISYVAGNGIKNKGNENVSSLAMHDDDNSQIILNNTLRFNPALDIPQNASCLSIFYSN
jgi:hypothetical protein